MKQFFTLISLTLCVLTLSAQKSKNDTGVIVADGFHITRPLTEMFTTELAEEPIRNGEEESEDRKHRKPQKFPLTAEKNGAAYGNDPKVIQTEMGNVPSAGVKSSWAGQTASQFRPFDPTGAAGPNHYVQMINSTTFKIYNKTTGAVMLTGTLGTLWNPDTANDGDPIVMYDKAADRWFLAQFGQTGNKIYIAISTTADPTGSYYTYSFTSPQFPDYLKFSVWQDGYYMTSNQSTQKVFAFERSAMLAGTPGARSIYKTFSPPASGFFVPLPGCAADGVLPPAGTPCPIFSYSDNGWGSGFVDRINIYKMAVDWTPTTPTATITAANNVTTAAFDGSYNGNWDDISQPNTTQKLDGIGGVCMYRAQWKTWNGYNTVVLNWAVKISSTQRSIKWCELRQDQTTGTWSMYQEGIYTPDAATRWMGAIAMDNNGSIGLSYLKSNSTNIYPGLFYTGRRSCDPLGTLPITETQVIAGTGSQNDQNRDGDYAHAVLDPDGVTFWSTSEYMGGTTGSNAAKTRIFSYQIPSCSLAASVAIAVTSGSNPACLGTPITFTATPTNGGDAPTYQWLLNGNPVGTNSPTYSSSSLTNGQIITCIMTSNLADVTGSPATSNAITMVINSDLVPSVSIALTTGTNPGCAGASMSFTATPTNGGSAPVYQWQVNGSNVGTNNAVYTTTTLTTGQIVTCNMTSNLACTTTANASSNAITVTINPSVLPAVSIAITAGTNPSAFGAAVTFTATPTNGGTTPSYQWAMNGTNAGTNSPTFTTTSLTNGQVVTCTMTSNATCAVPATAVAAGITMTITGQSTYCDASSASTQYEYISNVTMGSINSTSTATNYTDYTTLSTNVSTGTAYTINIAIGSGYTTDQIFIWCDWNHNGVFTDAGENVYSSTTSAGPFTASITPPTGASTGNTRMRIRLTDSSNGTNETPCGSSSYGEVEDYTLNVSVGTGIESDNTPFDNSGARPDAETFNVFPNPSNGNFTIQGVREGNYYLINEAGKLIQIIPLNAQNNFTYKIEGVASGFYVISGQNKNGIVKRKVVITN